MNQELKKLMDELALLCKDYYNTTDTIKEEQRHKIIECRVRITELCCDVLGIETEEQAKTLSVAIGRDRAVNYIRRKKQ